MTEELETQTAELEAAEEKKDIRWGQITAWVLVIGLLVLVGARLIDVRTGLQIGQPAPTFTVQTFEGDEITPEDMAGKVILLNFWASWCLPCEDEAAELEQAWEYYEDRGDVLFLGMAYSDTDNNAAEYIEKFGITYPNGHDWGTETTQDYGTTGVPETFIIDGDGNLVYIKIGPFASLGEILAAIDKVLEQ